MVKIGDVDKIGWEIGEWTTEVDVIRWNDETTGLPCMIARHPQIGHLCGYVGVGPGHPWFQDSYSNHYDVDVHGKLTFSEFISDEPNDVWWFGFDAGHGSTHGDKSPGPPNELSVILGFTSYGTYRNIKFMEDQIEKLALQVKEAKSGK